MSEASVLSAVEAGLEVDRWGTSFLGAGAESAFREWDLERATRALRTNLYAACAVWLAAIIGIALVRPAGLAPWAAGTVVVLLTIAATVLALRARSGRVVEWLLLVQLVGSGMLAIGLCNVHLESRGSGLAAAVWACFFQFRSAYVRPSRLAIAVATHSAAEVLVLGSDVAAGRLSVGLCGVQVFLVGSGYAIALLGALAKAASTRRTYRQTRIIEAQRATIARQQELLKRELSHQVAERSRELGAVLAKSDVTLDVRALKVGERFAQRYRVVAPLGAGGMGAVYEVERVTDSTRLALKAVVGEVSGASAARFAREAEIGASIHHPNLVPIVDVGVASGVPYLVMEFVRGGSLEGQRAKFGDVPWALPILRQIAEGLAALHDAGVVHRDLKPANVLLAEGGVAKISDFGISRFGALDEAASVDPNAATIGATPKRSSELTGAGVVMGTPLYMAPEAARGGRALDASADVFALGIIAYEMLTGRPPFAVPAVMLAMAEQPTPTVAAIGDARVPPALRALVLECLAGDPTKRPKVRALLAGLG